MAYAALGSIFYVALCGETLLDHNGPLWYSATLMPSLTNVTFPEELTPALHEAVEYYDFENLNRFFRTCGYILIQHHKRGDLLVSPYAFKITPQR